MTLPATPTGNGLFGRPQDAAYALFTALAEIAGGHADLARLVRHVLPGLTGGSAWLLYQFDADRGDLLCVAAGEPFGAAAGTLRVPLEDGVAGWVASRRETTPVADRSRDGRGDHLRDLLGPVNRTWVSGLCAPLRLGGGGLVGVIETYRPGPLTCTDGDLAVLSALSALAALVARAAPDAVREREAGVATSTIGIQEAERARLAADIHDGIAQRLASLNFHLDAAAGAIEDDPPFAAVQVGAARELAMLAAAETRAAIGGLRPPVLDDHGLGGALHSLARTTPGVPIDTSRVSSAGHLPYEAQTALYRIAQEALHNVVRHAQAGSARLELGTDGPTTRLRISDDGRGFDPSALPATELDRGLGLAGMRERARLVGATLEVRSRPGEGTTVDVRIPTG